MGGKEAFDVGLPCACVRTGAGSLREVGLPEEVWGRVESGKEDELKERCPLY